MTVHARAAIPDEVMAAERAVLGLTAAVGAMAGLTSAVVGDWLTIVALPTVALLVLLLRGAPPAAGYAASIVWLIFAPHAAGEALLVPLAMAVVCFGIGLGPDRLVRWVATDFSGRSVTRVAPGTGWIEED